MRTFDSNEQYFEAVAALAARLEAAGEVSAADELRDGLRYINGLTDGWALFLESVETVQRRFGRGLGPEEGEELRAVQDAARKAVYRK